MKKIRIIYVFLFTLSFYSNDVFSQQQTAYEKKIAEITQKYFSICYYGYNKQLTMSEKAELQMYTTGDNARKFIMSIGILNYAMNHTEAEVKNLVTQLDKDFKTAEKLKTAIDIQREKERKELAIKEKYERSFEAAIKNNIKSAFEKWNNKGEFEKQSVYEERIQNKSQNAFINVCVEQIKNKIEHYKLLYSLKKVLLPYNADNEFFIIKFSINEIEWENKINIPLADAENFKKSWSSLDCKIDDYDWCFVGHELCPNLITLSDQKRNFQFTLPLENQKEITYYFDELGINNASLGGFVFKYSNAKLIELNLAQEKFVKDSLEVVMYNNKLDSVFQDYNNQLLANPYNLEKTLISNYKKVSIGSDKLDSYNSSLNLLNRNNNRIRQELEYTFNREYSTAKQFFLTKEDFEHYYVQGKDSVQAEIIKRRQKQEEEKNMNFLINNSTFIESMDFQQEKSESASSTVGKSLLEFATNTTIAKKDYSNENNLRNKILYIIKDSNNKSNYLEIIDFIISTNKNLNKEWNKNGQYFKSKSEFYEAYISENYKKVLKSKK